MNNKKITPAQRRTYLKNIEEIQKIIKEAQRKRHWWRRLWPRKK